MKLSENKIVEWFLRIALSGGFLSAVADRFGLWSKELSAWGNWASFIKYTQSLNPYLPESMTAVIGYVATALEIVFGILLLTNFKTNFVAKASGILLLLFALSMTFSKSIKVPLDYSVFSASACAFGLSILVKSNQDEGAKNKV
jgi:thiosulfate dehydrogenase (quinone) large subunit